MYGNYGQPGTNYTQLQNADVYNSAMMPATSQQRLYALEQRYPQYGQSFPQAQQAQTAMPAAAQSQSPVMSVSGEQQARDYPLDLSGAPMIFVMSDGSKIFAKRFNVSNALPEFEIYEKASQIPSAVNKHESADNLFLMNVVNDFTVKLENMYAEIKNLREDVLNGNKSYGDSKPLGRQKPSNAAGTAAGAGDGTGGK